VHRSIVRFVIIIQRPRHWITYDLITCCITRYVHTRECKKVVYILYLHRTVKSNHIPNPYPSLLMSLDSTLQRATRNCKQSSSINRRFPSNCLQPSSRREMSPSLVHEVESMDVTRNITTRKEISHDFVCAGALTMIRTREGSSIY